MNREQELERAYATFLNEPDIITASYVAIANEVGLRLEADGRAYDHDTGDLCAHIDWATGVMYPCQ